MDFPARLWEREESDHGLWRHVKSSALQCRPALQDKWAGQWVASMSDLPLTWHPPFGREATRITIIPSDKPFCQWDLGNTYS